MNGTPYAGNLHRDQIRNNGDKQYLIKLNQILYVP